MAKDPSHYPARSSLDGKPAACALRTVMTHRHLAMRTPRVLPPYRKWQRDYRRSVTGNNRKRRSGCTKSTMIFVNVISARSPVGGCDARLCCEMHNAFGNGWHIRLDSTALHTMKW